MQLKNMLSSKQKNLMKCNLKDILHSELIIDFLWLLRMKEMWTLCLTLPSLGGDNIAATDGLWVIWASLLISIHREIIVDYFHANWHEWDKSIYI